MAKKKSSNKDKCKFYRDHRSIPNKLRKLHKHLSTHINDLCAATALQKVKQSIKLAPVG